MDQVIARLRGKLARLPGATLYLQAVQDLRVGGRRSSAMYQYTLQGDSTRDAERVGAAGLRQAADAARSWSTSTAISRRRACRRRWSIDRGTASRLGITSQNIDDTLYDAFGQRQVSTMYTPLNQYHVVMEVDPQFWQNPDGLQVHLRARRRRAPRCR